MKTLLIGNTGYVTKEFIKHAFPNSSTFILGETHLRSSKSLKLTVFPSLKEVGTAEIFKTYQFDQILYLANYLTYKNQESGKLEELQEFLNQATQQVNPKIIYLTGPDLANHPQELEQAAKALCLNWEEMSGKSVKVIHSPYLYSIENKKDNLYRIFSKLEQNHTVRFSENPEEMLNFMNMRDLANLVYKVFDSWDNQSETLSICNPFPFTFRDLTEALKGLGSESTIVFEKRTDELRQYSPVDNGELRQRYGWFIHYSLIDDLPDLYKKFINRGQSKEYLGNFRGTLFSLRAHGGLQKFLEVLIAFVASELLLMTTNGSTQFKMVDIRLLFVTLISTVFGRSYGIFASVLSMAGLFLSNMLIGVSWQSLVYNTDKWFPFATYILVALICGFIQMKHQDEKSMLKKENRLLNEQNDFLNLTYEDILHDKEQLVQQVVSSEHGASSLLAIFDKLEGADVETILAEAEGIVKDYLETDNVNIYCLQGTAHIKLANFPDLRASLEKDGFWVNRNLLLDYPAYALKVSTKTGLDYLLWVEEVSYEHASLYQLNFLQMLMRVMASKVDKAVYRQSYLQSQKTPIKKIPYNHNVPEVLAERG